IFGINFNLYYLILLRKIKSVLKSEELWTYIGIVTAASAVITVNIYNTSEKFSTFSSSLRHAAFQVSTIITTTGYATDDFNLWPGISKMILLILMFIGGCAGSTAGGFKLSRVILIFKQIKANLKHLLHPRSSESIRFEGKNVDAATVYGVLSYLAIYVFCFMIILIILSFDIFGIETNLSAAIACFNNVGPGFDAVGPAASYAGYSYVSKVTLSIAMLLGRLEIYPLLLLFSPYTWTKSRSKG
ncbi:MAG: TrkH family potassium uptake protein, partial [Acutalibacteraceae bacterium]